MRCCLSFSKLGTCTTDGSQGGSWRDYAGAFKREPERHCVGYNNLLLREEIVAPANAVGHNRANIKKDTAARMSHVARGTSTADTRTSEGTIENGREIHGASPASRKALDGFGRAARLDDVHLESDIDRPMEDVPCPGLVVSASSTPTSGRFLLCFPLELTFSHDSFFVASLYTNKSPA